MVEWRRFALALALLLGGAAAVMAVTATATAAAEEEEEKVRGFAIDKIWFQKKGGGYAINADLQVGSPALLEKILRGGYPVEIHFQLTFYQRRRWLPDRVMGDIVPLAQQRHVLTDPELLDETFEFGSEGADPRDREPCTGHDR